jgi:hypothetical protein
MEGQRALGLPEPWQRADESFGVKQQLRDATKGQAAVVLAALPDPRVAEQLWAEGRAIPADHAVSEALATELRGWRAVGRGQVRTTGVWSPEPEELDDQRGSSP